MMDTLNQRFGARPRAHTPLCSQRAGPGGPWGHTCGVALDMVGTHTGAAAWGAGLTCRRSPDMALPLAQGSLAGCGVSHPRQSAVWNCRARFRTRERTR